MTCIIRGSGEKGSRRETAHPRVVLAARRPWQSSAAVLPRPGRRTGLGTFDEDSCPRAEKAPVATYRDTDFARQTRHPSSSTFRAHLLYGPGAPVALATRTFEIDGRLCAHNGIVGDLPLLRQHLGAGLGRAQGETDSEHVFALITGETPRAGREGAGLRGESAHRHSAGDVGGAGIGDPRAAPAGQQAPTGLGVSS